MNRRFECTACGKCCHGMLPITLNEAIVHADRFPLALVWTPVRAGAKSFAVNVRLGARITIGKADFAIQIAATAYMPPALPCPALASDGLLCTIHADKPLRCRAMPFSPYRDESDQDDLLIPRLGWACKTDGEAPVVYQDKKIVARRDFDKEYAELDAQAPTLRAYASGLLATSPHLRVDLEKVSRTPGGYLALGFTTILPRLKQMDFRTYAERQLPVLQRFAKLTTAPEFSRFHRFYADGASSMARLLDSGFGKPV